MKPPDPSFADEFNVPQEDVVFDFDVRRATVSLSFQVHRLKVFVEAGLVAFSRAFFDFADEVPKETQHGRLAHLPKVFPAIFTAFRKLLLWGFARECLLASSLCCHAAFVSASTPGPAHQPCALRRPLERGTISAEVESMTTAMSVAMSLMQVPLGVGGCASTIVFATLNQRFGSVINPLRSASFGVSFGTVSLPPIWCGPAWDADFCVHEIMTQFWCL